MLMFYKKIIKSTSNLNNISKILEHLFLMCIKKHITSNYSPYNSAQGDVHFINVVQKYLAVKQSADLRKACIQAAKTVDRKVNLN